ncbi:glycosyltransferase family 4 protein [Cohnella zeiphila]|uniref:Glycosyltransferase family 4 protein n=1 Tax=Cohnella zeiphila TaxID=2761120 RepID=A0A7X0VVW3_9BACL|nr:glycosyltransferase family 4 protein [Cohnella zeiphila]MBB6732564.1 glycosyltransferase family 4 protein [Cohnella zeiphila]
MVKVAFVTPGDYPVPSPRGGSVERVVEKVVPLLVPSVDARIFGRIGRRLRTRGLHRGVPCERFPAKSKARYWRAVTNRLRVYRPDVIQIENRPLMVPVLKRRFPQAQVWLSLQSNTFLERPYMTPRSLPGCLESADRILVNSHFLKKYIARRVPQAAEKTGVVHLGVEANRFAGGLKELEKAERGWSGRRVVLFVGRLIPLKGVHLLLEALPELVREAPDVLVAIVGSPFYGSPVTTSYVRKLHRMAKPWKRHVHFQPYVSHLEIPRWFAAADIAVVPSVRREAFGLVNVEAMASGLPVVASRVGGVSEVVEDGVTGLLFDPANARSELGSRITRLLRDEALRQQMGRNGMERVQRHFTWEHTADQWLEQLRLATGRERAGTGPDRSEFLI